MKPGLAVLPLEVWADVFVYPWITRKKLARIVHRFKNRKFAEKLQFRLHDMGKHTLRYLTISSSYMKTPKVSFFLFYKNPIFTSVQILCRFFGRRFSFKEGMLRIPGV